MTTTTIRTLARGSRLALLLGAALSLPACVVETRAYHHRGPHDDSYRYDRQEDQVDGFVTAEGRCPTLRDHRSNQVYSLAGNTRDLRPGDHVLLQERETDTNPCGVQAPTLEVLRVDAVWRGDDHDSVYFDSRRDGDFETFISQNRGLGGWYADRYAYLNGGGKPGRDGDHGDRDRGDRDRGDRGRYDNGAPPPPPPPQYDDRDQDRDREMNRNQDMDRDNDRDNDRANNGRADNGEDEHEALRVDGRLDLRGSCPAIHTPDGVSYDLDGNLGEFHDGDRVRVIGVLQGRSACGGRTLEVNEIHPPER
jgi:hypothetical protein